MNKTTPNKKKRLNTCWLVSFDNNSGSGIRINGKKVVREHVVTKLIMIMDTSAI